MPQGGDLFSKWEVELLFRGAMSALLALIALLGLSLPARIKESKMMSIANAFGGGVILSAALVHMLPEASHCAELGEFPWGPTLLCAGYLFLLSTEAIVNKIAGAAAMHSLACCQAPLIPPTVNALGGTCALSREGSEKAGGSDVERGGCASRTGLGSGSRRRPYAAVVATCGLSVHAFLEGLALGLRASPGDFAVICATIGVHKGFAALALGAVLADGPSETTRQAAVVTFCAATPLGVILGSALLVSASCTLIAPLGAFAAGSLLWVAVHEVISPAMSRTDLRNVFEMLLATWVGFGAMTVLAVWV